MRTDTRGWPIRAGLLAILCTVTVFVYWPGLGGGFAFDDYPNIVLNTALHVRTLSWTDWIAAIFSSHSSDLQRPLAMLSFAAQHYFTGLDPVPLKAANLAIHLVNSLLVFGLLRSLLGAVRLASDDTRAVDFQALAGAALWTLLPINLMPVLFIVQRMESLSHTFVFAGLWLYVSGRREQLAGTVCWGKVLTSLILFPVLGLLSKESAVLLPLYSFCLELFVFGFRTGDPRREPRILWLYGLVLFLPALLGGYWMLSRALAPGSFGSRDFSLIERLLTEPRVVLDYLRWTLLPNIGQLGLYHDDYPISRGLLQPPQTLLAIATLLVMPALAWLLRRRRPLTAIGLCWFLAAQVLTATFLPLELVFEHRNYFASLGICLMLVDLLVIAPTSKTRRRISAAATIALLFFYGFTTHLRAIEWSDPLRFAQTEAAKHPLSPRATYQLGQTYVILSQAKPGTVMTQAAFAALEHARTVPRSGILPTQGLLLLSSRTGATMNEDWWQDIEGKLREQPIGPQELGAMAALTDCQIGGHCRFPNAKLEALYVAALSQGPHPEVFNLYGSFLLNLRGNTTIAERMWRESVRLSPTNLQYRINLTRLLVATGKYGEARTEIARLRKLSRLGATRMEADRLQRRLDAATAGSSPPSGRADDR